jgi:outer membrane protein insertion porin family
MARHCTRTIRIIAYAAALALLPAAARAQAVAAQYVGRPVQEIRLQIEGTPTSDPNLLDLVPPRAGAPLEIAAVRESIGHLYSLGRFQDVQVEAADAAGGGVILTFNLIPVHSVERILFRGALGLTESQLRNTVVERYGASPSIGRIDAASRTLQQFYADQGYLRARVTGAAEILHKPERAVVTFDIDAGPRATIDSVEIEGNPRATREEFLRRIGATIGTPYLRSRLQERLDDYVAQLKKQRFYETVASVRAIESTDGAKVSLGIAINAGLPVVVRFEGDPVPRDRLKELAPIESDGAVEEDLLEDSEGRIENYLRQMGYWKADATVTRERTAEALTIVFTIKRGRQYRVAGPAELSGATAIGPGELAALVPIKTGELFLESQLTAAVEAIRAYYRVRGFASVDIKSAVNESDPPSATEGLVRPAIVVAEGPRSAIGAVTITGNTAIASSELAPLVRIAAGDPYYEPGIIAARDALALEYLNRGFAAVVVTPAPKASPDRTRVDLVFEIQEGPQAIVDQILIVGNVHTNPEVILRELQFRQGEPLGLQDQFESRRRLSALGLFRRVQITELAHGNNNERDVLVAVEEAPATSIGYGGGIEGLQTLRATGEGGQAEERFEVAPRGFFDIGRSNLFGANRSVNVFTRIGFRRRNTPDAEQDNSRFGFIEYRVGATYRQPRWFGPNNLTVTGLVEQGARTSFNFARSGVSVDVIRRLTSAMRISGRYSLSSTRAFDTQLSEEDEATIDRLFPRVRLSGFSGAIAHDTRDDLLDPTRGFFLSGEGTLAARALGGQVGFMKTYVQAFAFRTVPGTKRLILATRAALGLADGFERLVDPVDANGQPIEGEPVAFEDLPASERFFAGGDTTIRGYALDSVGAPETISANGFPTGGNAVLLLNGELRFPVWKEFGGVVFADGGNVFRRVTEFDPGELRGSVGFGLRYQSPLGPIRVDLGFKLDRREIRGSLERRTALHFSLGQAF